MLSITRSSSQSESKRPGPIYNLLFSSGRSGCRGPKEGSGRLPLLSFRLSYCRYSGKTGSEREHSYRTERQPVGGFGYENLVKERRKNRLRALVRRKRFRMPGWRHYRNCVDVSGASSETCQTDICSNLLLKLYETSCL